MRVQYRQIPDEAVRAIASREILWQISPNEFTAAVSYADEGDDARTVVVSTFGYGSFEPTIITTFTDYQLLEAMNDSLHGASMILGHIQQLEAADGATLYALKFEELATEWKKSKYR